MLLSLSILAVVGGALAFTVKSGTRFCTALPVSNACTNVVCPTGTPLQAGGVGEYLCTAPTIIGGFDECHVTQQQPVQCGSTSANSAIE